MIEKLKNKKVHVTVAFGVIVAGVVLFQGAIPREAREPKILSLSPSEGPVGTQVTITGSGFTTSFAGISGTKVKENILAPGNYILIKDEVINQPLISADGNTLTIRVDLVSSKLIKECAEKFSKKKPEPCKVQIKVVNAYGKPSNEKEFTITGLQEKKLSYSVTRIDLPTTSPITVPIPSYIPDETNKDVEVARIRISAPATNEHPIVVELDMAGISSNYPSAPSTDWWMPCSYLGGRNGAGYLQNVNDSSDTHALISGWTTSFYPACGFAVFIGDESSGSYNPGYDFSHLLIAPGTQKDFSLKIGASTEAKPGTFTFLIKPFAYSWRDTSDPAIATEYPVENDGKLSYPNAYGGVIDYFRSNPIQFVK